MNGTCRRKQARRVVSLLTLALACGLAGCASDGGVREAEPVLPLDTAVPPMPLPANYKADILALLRVYLRDPTGIRGARISDAMTLVGRRNRQIVCLQFDAKEGGNYSGLKDRIVVFSNGRLDRMTEANPQQCVAANFQPFPEAERLSR